MDNNRIKGLVEELENNINNNSFGSYLFEGDLKSSNLIADKFTNQIKDNYLVLDISCESLLTDSYSFIKKLISPYITLLEKDNPSLLEKYKQSLCLLMPSLREKEMFKDVILGLDVPREENPTSLNNSFIVSTLNGIINFLLELPEQYAKNQPIVFILRDVDKCDFSSVQLINRLIIRSTICSYYVVITSSNQDILEEELDFNMKLLLPSNQSDLDINNQLDKLNSNEKHTILESYIESCGINDTDGLYSVIYQNASQSTKDHYHRKQIKLLNETEKDQSSKYAKLLFHMEALNEGKIEDILESAAYYCRINGYYKESIYYVSHAKRNYWELYDNEQKAKLLRIKGVGHIRLQDNSEALKSLGDALNLSSDPYTKARLCYTIGSFVVKHGDENSGPDWLEKGFEQVRELNTEKATLERLWLNNSKALIHYRHKRFKEAELIEKENLIKFKETFSPDEHVLTHAILHYNTAYVLQDSGHLEEAIEYINEGIRLVPSNLDLYNNKANILQQLGSSKEAISYYSKVKNVGYPKVEVYINCGNAYLKLGEFDLALENYNYAISLMPDNPNTWNARGHLMYLQGEFEKAINDFSRALKVDPKFVSALINRANAYAELGKRNEAITDYNHAEKLSPKIVEIYVNRGALFQDSGDSEKAKTDLEHALNFAPSQTQAYIYVNLAVIYSENKDFEKAKIYLENAVNLEPREPWIKYNKAHLHLQLNELNLAQIEINKALEISPSNSEFLELKQEISNKLLLV